MRYNTTKRDPIKNSFIMPNEIFRLGLSEGAIAVYAYLLYCEDRGTYQCYPSYNTIACAIGKSKSSIRKYVAELVTKRLIETEHTTVILKDGRKHNGSLKYTILPIDKAVRYHEEVQRHQLKIEEAKREAENVSRNTIVSIQKLRRCKQRKSGFQADGGGILSSDLKAG